jgi:hypothetical protein
MLSFSGRWWLVLVLVAGQPWIQNGQAADPVLRVDLSDVYPWVVSEGSPVFHWTAQNQLVLLPGIGSLYKEPRYALASDNQGRTWRHWGAFDTWPTMIYADVVRSGNELLAFGHHDADIFTGTDLWRSNDEGLTWTGGNRLTQDTDRWGPMNQRVLETNSSRLIVPIQQLLGGEGSGPNQLGTLDSDNGGVSWQRSPMFGPPPLLPDSPEGFREPAVVELSNEQIWMTYASRYGTLWQSFSDDDGATWGPPSSTGLVSPLAGLNAKRIPGSDAVILVWNNCEPGTSTHFGDNPSLWHPRSPLVYAISHDNCQTWSEPVTIETGVADYASICFSDSEMFLSYWMDPDPTALGGQNANSHLMVVAYDIKSLIQAPEPSTSALLATGLLGLLVGAWRRRRSSLAK